MHNATQTCIGSDHEIATLPLGSCIQPGFPPGSTIDVDFVYDAAAGKQEHRLHNGQTVLPSDLSDPLLLGSQEHALGEAMP